MSMLHWDNQEWQIQPQLNMKQDMPLDGLQRHNCM
jgi:hypothetical protein